MGEKLWISGEGGVQGVFCFPKIWLLNRDTEFMRKTSDIFKAIKKTCFNFK